MGLNKKGGMNDISRKFLVMCKRLVVYHLNKLFKFSITSGIYSNISEIAQITPVHKKGSNYRPVFMLSSLSKVFENIIYNRPRKFCQTSIFCSKSTRCPKIFG